MPDSTPSLIWETFEHSELVVNLIQTCKLEKIKKVLRAARYSCFFLQGFPGKEDVISLYLVDLRSILRSLSHSSPWRKHSRRTFLRYLSWQHFCFLCCFFSLFSFLFRNRFPTYNITPTENKDTIIAPLLSFNVQPSFRNQIVSWGSPIWQSWRIFSFLLG